MSGVIKKIWLSASAEWPALLLYGIILNGGNPCGEFSHYFPYIGRWGKRIEDAEPIICNSEQLTFRILWYSIRENKFYQYEKDFTIKANKNSELLIGLFANGEIILWEYSDVVSEFLGYDMGVDKTQEVLSLMKQNPDLIKLLDPNENTFEGLQYHYNDFLVSNYNFGDGEALSISKLSQSYNYKFQLNVSYDDIDMEINNLHIRFYDGSYIKIINQNLMKYKKRALPQYIRIICNIGKFNFDIQVGLFIDELSLIVKRFYGIHEDTNTDFIITFDFFNKKYELALYRQGLKEPVVIPESAYQLIVFKNKFEDYRSENYNQPRGAWIW